MAFCSLTGCFDLGTYSVVFKARDKTSNKFVAMKRVQGDREGVSAYRKVLLSRKLI